MYIKTNRSQILVDPDQYPALSQRRWNHSKGGHVTCARQSIDPPEWPKRVPLTWFVIGPQPKQGSWIRAHHNHNRLDWRRSNMYWQPIGEFLAEQRAQKRAQRKYDSLTIAETKTHRTHDA